MKKINVWMMAAAAAACVTMNSCNQGVSTDAKLSSQIDSLSYAVGINVGNNIKASAATFPGEDSLKIDLVIKGLLTVLKDSAAQKMTFEDASAYINAYIMKVQQAQAEAELKVGQDFLAANRSKEGVITTASGLQYKVISEGTGAKPTVKDKVRCHYTGRLLDGTVFDSSVQRGQPAEFEVGQVIPGWQEVLQLMPVGSKFQVWIPSNLAYGTQGAGPIKPNSTLEFEIELLEIVK
ncbi:peptidylprolyl isomerase [Tannerella sp. oral taxon BU063 isolate Cell 1/3]|uniref:Peptidyl-prolyl cis-trans isomerase n=1 Tax=Tannerella sp. oral taxon BU063 isolate Cell 1/3 TaxID=1411022 RepID=W2CIA8_9BACT|nr:peptidylprolyl isomerase [Tannerella sp. oral taxon BU063 isolate Cell 1/3]